MIEYKYAYLTGILFFLIIWILLYFRKKELRKEMLIMSLITAPLGITQVLFFQDYWKPQYILSFYGVGLEEFLFCFLIGGIAGVIYEEFFITKIIKTKRDNSKTLMILGIFGLLILLFLLYILKINSIYSSSITLIFMGIIILMERNDLFKNAIGSGVLVALIMFLFYIIYQLIFPTIIQNWWKLNNISGIMIFGVPIEEIIWGFSYGFFAGPIYEFWRGIKEK